MSTFVLWTCRCLGPPYTKNYRQPQNGGSGRKSLSLRRTCNWLPFIKWLPLKTYIQVTLCRLAGCTYIFGNICVYIHTYMHVTPIDKKRGHGCEIEGGGAYGKVWREEKGRERWCNDSMIYKKAMIFNNPLSRHSISLCSILRAELRTSRNM